MVAADAGDGQYVAALLDGGEEPGAGFRRRAGGEDQLIAAHGAGPQPVGPGGIPQADLDPLLLRGLVAELGQPYGGA